MDRQFLAYMLIALMVALAISVAVFELTSRKKRAERRRKQVHSAEYERIMAKRGK